MIKYKLLALSVVTFLAGCAATLPPIKAKELQYTDNKFVFERKDNEGNRVGYLIYTGTEPLMLQIKEGSGAPTFINVRSIERFQAVMDLAYVEKNITVIFSTKEKRTFLISQLSFVQCKDAPTCAANNVSPKNINYIEASLSELENPEARAMMKTTYTADMGTVLGSVRSTKTKYNMGRRDYEWVEGSVIALQAEQAQQLITAFNAYPEKYKPLRQQWEEDQKAAKAAREQAIGETPPPAKAPPPVKSSAAVIEEMAANHQARVNELRNIIQKTYPGYLPYEKVKLDECFEFFNNPNVQNSRRGSRFDTAENKMLGFDIDQARFKGKLPSQAQEDTITCELRVLRERNIPQQDKAKPSKPAKPN